eukprot:4208906-Amphidinium_carterae.1
MANITMDFLFSLLNALQALLIDHGPGAGKAQLDRVQADALIASQLLLASFRSTWTEHSLC